ncbi:tetratricopeptide repeat protein [bacterium]|nr:tetratricopeptide repeat protein [bacterium]
MTAAPGSESAAPLVSGGSARGWIAGLVFVLLLVLLAHGRGLRGDFLLWDDTNHVTQNPAIRALTWDNVRIMFTEPIAKLYLPLTWLSFATDHLLWGRDPFGYHLVNLLLHLANTALVFFLVRAILVRTFGVGATDAARREPRPPKPVVRSSAGEGEAPAEPRSLPVPDSTRSAAAVALLTAALFGLHPTRVESVAWITERKDVLFACCYLLAMMAWLRWGRTGRRGSYYVAFAAFILSALAKPAAVTFPMVALLLDRYVLGRLGPGAPAPTRPPRATVWLEQLPFLAVSVIIALATWRAQAGGAGETVASAAVIPWSARPGLVGYCALFYLRQSLWPANLSAIYPTFEEMGWAPATGWLWLFAGLALTATVWLVRRRAPALWPCWLFYLATLSPTIGLVPVGIHVVADRYAYLPLLGLFLPMGLGLAWLLTRWPTGPRRAGLRTLAVGGLLLLTVMSAERTAAWRNTETLFQSVLAGNPRCLPALINLTHWYARTGRADAAVALGRRAVDLAPQSVWARQNLALALLEQARPAEALAVLAPVTNHPLAATAGIHETVKGIERHLPPSTSPDHSLP